MEIKSILRFPKDENATAKAYVDVVFDESFIVKGVKVMDGKDGVVVSMPTIKKGDEYVQRAYPITKEFREQLYGAILDEYQHQVDKAVACNQIKDLGKPCTGAVSQIENLDSTAKMGLTAEKAPEKAEIQSKAPKKSKSQKAKEPEIEESIEVKSEAVPEQESGIALEM
jgi:stage V sporulation protein G